MGFKEDWESLTEKQRRFCQEFPIDGSGRKAAIRAGYAKGVAHVTAAKLMKKPVVKRVIDAIRKEDARKVGLDREIVLRELLFLVTKRGSSFVNEDGTPKSLDELEEAADACVDGFKVKEYVDAMTGNSRIETEFKTGSKTSALELAAKILGMMAPEKVEQLNVNVPLPEGFFAPGEGVPDEIETMLEAEQ